MRRGHDIQNPTLATSRKRFHVAVENTLEWLPVFPIGMLTGECLDPIQGEGELDLSTGECPLDARNQGCSANGSRRKPPEQLIDRWKNPSPCRAHDKHTWRTGGRLQLTDWRELRVGILGVVRSETDRLAVGNRQYFASDVILIRHVSSSTLLRRHQCRHDVES